MNQAQIEAIREAISEQQDILYAVRLRGAAMGQEGDREIIEQEKKLAVLNEGLPK